MSDPIQFIINESPTSLIKLAEHISSIRQSGVYICTNDPEQSQKVSQVLWSHPKDRFIPNSVQLDAPESVILIHNLNPPPNRQLIINLSNRLLSRVNIEWITQDITLARQRYQHWRRLGHTIHTLKHS